MFQAPVGAHRRWNASLYSDNYITASKEVVLAFPHKDCVLEGGQTKEDQKRNEIFWNETLAPDTVVYVVR